jgi:hypothetical protein
MEWEVFDGLKRAIVLTLNCDKCGRTVNVSDSVKRFVCFCGGSVEAEVDCSRQRICDGCKYRVAKGCALYLKPCTVKRLWADQIDPPEQCEKREQFLE